MFDVTKILQIFLSKFNYLESLTLKNGVAFRNLMVKDNLRASALTVVDNKWVIFTCERIEETMCGRGL